jgi:hypothetical protein
VGLARKQSENGQEITLVGRIGGSSEPFIDGLAAFTIVDPNVPYCADDEGCPTPWDYCCETDAVKSNIATVKIIDTSGKPIQRSAKSLIPLKELSVIVVKGIEIIFGFRCASGDLPRLATRNPPGKIHIKLPRRRRVCMLLEKMMPLPLRIIPYFDDLPNTLRR